MTKFQIGNYVRFKGEPKTIKNNDHIPLQVGLAQITEIVGSNVTVTYQNYLKSGAYFMARENTTTDKIEGVDWDEEYLMLLGFTFKDKVYYFDTPDYHYRLIKDTKGIEVLLRVKEESEISKETYWETFPKLQVHEVQNIYFNYTDEQTI